MGGKENADGNLSENKIEEEKEDDSLRTVNCLRGRLLAERLASRNAAKEADHLQNKMQELQNQLNEESKSRKRAEKKLKSLMKRLENVKCFGNLEENDSESSSWSNEKPVEDCADQPLSHSHSQTNPNSNQANMDNTTTFVAVEMGKEKIKRINDGEVIDVNVKQVLESLNNAKEQLQSSMEERRRLKMMSMRIIKVG